MKKEIQLTYKKADLEEVYFGNNEGSYILSSTTKSTFIGLVFSILLYTCIVIYSVLNDIPSFIQLGAIIPGVFLINYVVEAWRLYKWKRESIRFIDKLLSAKQNSLVISDTHFTLNKDEEMFTEKWDKINHVEIKKGYTVVIGANNYIFPRCSMTNDEYEELTQTIKSKYN